jgi:hypothetical protein
MNRRRLVAGAVVLALIAGAVGVTAWYLRASQEDIFLESANSVGPDPFTDSEGVGVPTTTSSTSLSTSTSSSTFSPPSGTTTTALFGGSGDQTVCDPEKLITFLESNADRARAWVAALNDDETFKWSGGDSITVEQIGPYIRELTPTFLAEDTRVTNHGFKDGEPTPRQSVLQAGTAVLVDEFGIPRVRCACGNPLAPPEEVDRPHYEGPCWDDTTTTSSSTTTSSTTTTIFDPSSTTSSSSTSTTLGSTQPIGLRPGDYQLVLARPSNRCGDDPYCSPPGCTVSTTTSTTVFEASTTTVPGQTTITRPPLRPTTTRRPTVTTRPPTTTTVPATTVTTQPASTTSTDPIPQ